MLVECVIFEPQRSQREAIGMLQYAGISGILNLRVKILSFYTAPLELKSIP
jgi:hypothetical protein